nr:hypothetical protein [Candidatus Freyarchaeota archaeon]
MSERPEHVAGFVIIIMILGILIIVGGIIALILAAPTLMNLQEGFSPIIGIVGIIVGAIYLMLGFGLWMLKNWARILTIILAILTIIGSILGLFIFPIGTVAGVIGLFLSIIIIVYLTREDVSAYFKTLKI